MTGIVTVAPGLFSANADGQGVTAAVVLRVRCDGTQVYEPVAQFDTGQGKFVHLPIDPGPSCEQVYLIQFGTGYRHRSSLSTVSCKIGGVDLPVLFAGAQGGYVGLDQINVGPLPRSLAGRGEVEITITVDGKPANLVRIAVR